MQSAVGSPVKTLASHRKPKQDLMEPDQAYGLNTSDAFACLDESQESSWWKTWTLFGAMDLEESSEIWPASGLMLSGRLYRHAPWVPHTCDGACSSWPTPTKSMGERGWGLSSGKYSGKLRAKRSTQERALSQGYFPHPELIEVLMGFPIGATELVDLETQSMPVSLS